MACCRSAFQCQGRSSCSRVCGISAMRARTLASQAWGWTLLSFAVPMTVFRSLAVDRALDIEQRVDPRHRLQRQPRDRRRPLAAPFGRRDVGELVELPLPVRPPAHRSEPGSSLLEHRDHLRKRRPVDRAIDDHPAIARQHNLHPARRKLALRDDTLGWWAHRRRARLLARCCLDHHRHELAGPAGALRLAEQTPPRENLIGVEVVALGQQLGLLDNASTSNEAGTESMARQVACY